MATSTVTAVAEALQQLSIHYPKLKEELPSEVAQSLQALDARSSQHHAELALVKERLAEQGQQIASLSTKISKCIELLQCALSLSLR